MTARGALGLIHVRVLKITEQLAHVDGVPPFEPSADAALEAELAPIAAQLEDILGRLEDGLL